MGRERKETENREIDCEEGREAESRERGGEGGREGGR